MAQTKEQRLAAVHAEAIAEFDRVQSALRDERMQCLQDRRFYSLAGAQWEGPLGDQFENRPRFEFNKTHMAVIRIFNEYRNNRITVDFTPKDGTTRQDLADTCDGLYRADERDSGAQEAYDNAFEEGVGGGFGAARVTTAYEDEEDDENDKQRIRIEPIYDADSSVYFDLDAKRQDKADAKRCWVLYSMTPEAFIEEFGHDPSTWNKVVTQRYFDWMTTTVVYVAEYYRVEETTQLVHWFRGLDEEAEDLRITDDDLTDEKAAQLKATGYREVRQKRVKVRKVHKYIMSGNGIEEDCGYIAGKCIPIIPFYAKRWFVDNVERCMGHVRLAKDAQRLVNSLLTWLTDIAMRSPAEKPILTPEQILGHAQMWAEDNVQQYPYLLLNALKDAQGNTLTTQPIGYTKAPDVPPAMAALVEIASGALTDLLGNQQAGEEMQSNISGKVVELIQTRLDMQVFIYMSNFAKFMQRVGEVWLSMAREVYVEDGRTMKTVTQDGTADTVTLREPMVNEDGEPYEANNLDEATFDVWTDVGPSSSSKRAATVRALTSIAAVTADPQQQSVLMATAIMNMDGEGLQDVRQWFRKTLVSQGVVQPTEEEKQELAQAQQGQGPDPQSQYLMAAADQANAEASQARAKTYDTLASAKLKEAQTVKTLVDAHSGSLAAHAGALSSIAGGLPQPQGALPPA